MTFSPHDKDFQSALTAFMDEYKPSLKELKYKYAYKDRAERPDLAPLVSETVECSVGRALH